MTSTIALTPEEKRELKRLLLKAVGQEGDPDSQPDPMIVVMAPAAQPQHGSAKVHGDKIDTGG